jgi:hypothetical protein
MRGSLGSHIHHRNLNGFTAARLKRMNAIRRKLQRMDNSSRPLGLHKLEASKNLAVFAG